MACAGNELFEAPGHGVDLFPELIGPVRVEPDHGIDMCSCWRGWKQVAAVGLAAQGPLERPAEPPQLASIDGVRVAWAGPEWFWRTRGLERATIGVDEGDAPQTPRSGGARW